MTDPNSPGADDTTVTPTAGFLIGEIATVLNTLGVQHTMDGRIAAAATTLGTVSTQWLSNNPLAVQSAKTLSSQLNALGASYPADGNLANAIDCAESLAGIWSGEDYV